VGLESVPFWLSRINFRASSSSFSCAPYAGAPDKFSAQIPGPKLDPNAHCKRSGFTFVGLNLGPISGLRTITSRRPEKLTRELLPAVHVGFRTSLKRFSFLRICLVVRAGEEC
jgi:hypothetical protein